MRRRLIGDVSHELRTPLTAIKGSMEGLMDGILPATDESYQQVLAEAERFKTTCRNSAVLKPAPIN